MHHILRVVRTSATPWILSSERIVGIYEKVIKVKADVAAVRD
jgi:hypothetical protein